MLTSWKNVLRAIFKQICATITEKCILSYSLVNITDNLLIINEVITSSLIMISDTAKVIFATNKLMSATEATLKVIWATSKMILSTEENTATLKVIAATTNMILATEKSDHSHFKRCLIHYQSDLSHCRSDHMLLNNYLSHYKGNLGYKQIDVSPWSYFKIYLTHYKSDLGHGRSDHSHFTNYRSPYKSDLSQIRMITSSIIIIWAITKVILVTNKLMSATEAIFKIIWATTKVTLVTNEIIITAILKVISPPQRWSWPQTNWAWPLKKSSQPL